MRAGWTAEATRFLALRLRPGDDLRGGLDAAFRAEGLASGFVVSLIGSLSVATVRPAGSDTPLVVDIPTEIVSLSGTFAAEGCHLHMSVADARGRMTGGHVLAGCRVRTTVEAVLALTDAAGFRRRRDPETGYAELTFDER